MVFEACQAYANGLEIVPCPAQLFCKGRKSNRRRILLDPASKNIKA
jgi:hypothetical protein